MEESSRTFTAALKAFFRAVGKWLLKALLALFSALPLCVHHFNAIWIGWLLRNVVRYRVGVVRENLHNCYPDRSEEELRRIEKAFYRHFGDIVCETVYFGGCGPKRLRRSHIVEITNPEVLGDLYERCPSVVVLMSHAGNWELLGGAPYYNFISGDGHHIREDNSCVTYLKQSSEMWDEILRDNRMAPLPKKKTYEGYLESRQVLRYILQHKNEKKFYHFNTDQRPYFKSPDFVTVNFMHQETWSMYSAAAIAHKLGFAVVFLRMRTTSEHKYTIEYVPICEDASKMEVQTIMQQFYDHLAVDLELQPENYLWTHRRWRRYKINR